MKYNLIKFLFLIVFVLIFSNKVLAGTTGSVSGKTENALGTALPYVMVIWVDGRGYGYRVVLSDQNGNFNFRDNYWNEHVDSYVKTVDYAPYSITIPAYETRDCCPMCPDRRLGTNSVYRCIDGNQNLADYIYKLKINSYVYDDLSESIKTAIGALKVSEWTPIKSHPNISNKIWANIPDTASESLLNQNVDYLKYQRPLLDYQFLANRANTSDFEFYPGHGPNPNFDFRTMKTVIGDYNHHEAYNCGTGRHRVWWYPPYNDIDPDRAKNGPFHVPLNNGAYNTINLRSSNCMPTSTDRCASRCVLNQNNAIVRELLRENEYSPYTVGQYIITNGSCISRDCPGIFKPCLAPTPYPTIHMIGNLHYFNETQASNCQGDQVSTANSAALSLAIDRQTPNAYFSRTCAVGKNQAGSLFTNYSCNFSLRNYYTDYYEPVMATPTPRFNIQIKNSRYVTRNAANISSSRELMSFWGKEATGCTYNCNQQTPLVCSDKKTLATLNFASPVTSSIEKNIYFGRESDTYWFKLKDASFSSTSTYSKIDAIPESPTQYTNRAGSVDPDDSGALPYVIIGEAGILSSPTELNLGLNAEAKYSSHNWNIKNYPINTGFQSSSEYLVYANNSSKFEQIANLESNIGNDGRFFIIKSDITINDSNKDFFNKRRGIVVDGTVNFNLGANSKFDPSAPVVIIAKRINFYSGATNATTSFGTSLIEYAKGVFVADTIDTGKGNDVPLKIKGNLVVTLANSKFFMSRTRTLSSSPTLFVVFDAKPYVDLFEMFPVNRYESF